MVEKIEAVINEMTLEEKASLCSGSHFWYTQPLERLNIPRLMVTDGPHGLRKQPEGSDHLGVHDSVPATCFPSAAGLACTWDRELIAEVGRALGVESQAENVSVLLGPGANIKRSPLCGRNFEYFSEDPYLSTEMAAHHIQGVQSEGVGASLKHFAANNQEHRRMSVDAVIDERTLREIYLASFEGAVKKSQPWTVMSSYNRLNGEYCSEHPVLLTDILREEWGYDGIVVSDWGAVNEREAALAAGLELEMPPGDKSGDDKIVAAVKDGSLPEETLNEAVRRLLKLVYRALENKQEGVTFNEEDHHQLARQVAGDSMVLLKNEDDILPLEKNEDVAVIGSFAKAPRYQGGGSSHVNPTKLDEALNEIKQHTSAGITFAQGFDATTDVIDETLMQEAKEQAEKAEKVVIFAGLPDHYESEAYDRTHLHLPTNQVKLIEEISAITSEVVVILSNGAPVEMPWIHNVKAVLEGYLGGQAVGGAAADVLYGAVNPSGRLAETFPEKLSHTPAHLHFPGEGDKAVYSEGLFVGYRYYDAKEIAPLFPFGHGLSYTTFSYRDLRVSQTEITDQDELDVYVTVKNTGDRAGKEVVQFYVKEVDSPVIRPEKELKQFTKVQLDPGEEKEVKVTLDKRAFAYYDTDRKDWIVASGEFQLLAGHSAANIAEQASVQVTSTVPKSRPVFHRNTTIGDILVDQEAANTFTSYLASLDSDSGLLGAVKTQENRDEMMDAMVQYMPLRALIPFSQGAFNETHLKTLLEELNAYQLSS